MLPWVGCVQITIVVTLTWKHLTLWLYLDICKYKPINIGSRCTWRMSPHISVRMNAPTSWAFASGCLRDYWQLEWPDSSVLLQIHATFTIVFHPVLKWHLYWYWLAKVKCKWSFIISYKCSCLVSCTFIVWSSHYGFAVILKGLRPVLEGLDALFAQARVHCDNKPRHIGLNHDYNMTSSISPSEF